MSRVGKKPVPIPDGVTVKVSGLTVTVTGSGKQQLHQTIQPSISVLVEDGQVRVDRASDQKRDRALHGLTRQLVANMITGVTQGFTKELEIVGIGYRAQVQGRKLVLQIGFCHPVEIDIPEDLTVECRNPTSITVKGADKQRVGQLAATIRAVRKPEPYKGKGIRYSDEHVRRLQGKSFATGAT